MFLEYLSSVCNNRHIASIAAVKSWIRFGQYNKTAGNTMISDRQWVGLDTADNNKAWVGSTESERGGLDTAHTIKQGSEYRHPTESDPGCGRKV